uniref:Sushi domain-containing protein n=2 Tax=Tetraodon nigroviridis TaxID=99883 RepID=H3D462_TETNG
MHNNLRVAGLPQANGKMKIGHQLQFECTNGFMLDGQEQVTCLESGQWDAPFPTCSEICRITNIPSSVRFYSPTGNREVRKGQKVTFGCKRPETYIHGNADVECLDNGQWSHSFPTCGDPLPCGKPPALESGDLREGLQFEYLHGERVEYICQNLYVMEGSAHRTCQNGEWIGAVKCLKPCIITVNDMQQRNIALKHKNPQKQYTPHNDQLEFTCSHGRPARREDRNMIRYCRDGVMVLPTCY